MIAPSGSHPAKLHGARLRRACLPVTLPVRPIENRPVADVPVGRDRELAVLRDCLTAAEHRPGAAVLMGVAGIGKSWPTAELPHPDTCQPSTNRHLTSAYSAIWPKQRADASA